MRRVRLSLTSLGISCSHTGVAPAQPSVPVSSPPTSENINRCVPLSTMNEFASSDTQSISPEPGSSRKANGCSSASIMYEAIGTSVNESAIHKMNSTPHLMIQSSFFFANQRMRAVNTSMARNSMASQPALVVPASPNARDSGRS